MCDVYLLMKKYLGNIFSMDSLYNRVYKRTCDLSNRKRFGHIDHRSHVGGKVVNTTAGRSSGRVWWLKDDCAL